MYERIRPVGGDRQQVVADLRRRLASMSGSGSSGSVSSSPVSSSPASLSSSSSGESTGSGVATLTRPPRIGVPDADASTVDLGVQFDQPAPTVGAGVLPVPEALAEILPNGGLPRGGVVTLGGDGMTSLLFGLLCRPGTSWSAVVGMPELGLLAAAEIGVDLSRVVLVPDPGPEVLQVLSVLSDGVEVIVAAAPGGPLGSAARLRVLTARLRQRGAVLLVAGRWPGADLVLTARQSGWAGIGAGHGRLHDRVLDIEVGGRGAAGRGRRGAVLLAGSGAGAVGILRGPSPESGALADVAADAV